MTTMGQELNVINMLNKILEQAREHEEVIRFLRANSKYWPEILYRNGKDDIIYASTLVRKKKDDKWYAIHCVDSTPVPIGSHNVEGMIERMAFNVHLIQHFHVITGIDLLDKDQSEEEERLKKRFPLHFK
jgi:hypothetical protein